MNKEQIKLTATYMNNLAVACVSLGFTAPLVAALYGLANSAPGWKVIFLGAGWLIAGLALHIYAVSMLGDRDQ